MVGSASRWTKAAGHAHRGMAWALIAVMVWWAWYPAVMLHAR